MKKRTIALLLAMMLVFGVAVGGTIAWLTSATETVTNTFTAGSVDITLDEKNVDGDKVGEETPERDTQNDYELMPGSTYVKDPTVHVADNSEPCFVYVTVSNGLAGLEADAEGTDTIAEQMAANDWVKLANTTLNGLDVWYFDKDSVATTSKNAAVTIDTATGGVNAGQDLVVFESFTIAGTANLANVKDVVVNAYAIQAENLTNAATAWATGASADWTTT